MHLFSYSTDSGTDNNKQYAIFNRYLNIVQWNICRHCGFRACLVVVCQVSFMGY